MTTEDGSTGLEVSSGAGYAHGRYAEALLALGQPRLLPSCEAWVLERPIKGKPHSDLMGCYPIFACRNWDGLPDDLDALARGGEDNPPVCLSLVTDPLGSFDPQLLERCFPDVCRPYKEHFVVDLADDGLRRASSHHRRNARKALQRVSVEILDDPTAHAAEWCNLYENLISRHEIRGIAAFSPQSFAQQLKTPGMLALRARHEGETVGMVLWYLDGNRGYYHLGAYSDLGYELKCSFALFWTAITRFTGTLRWLSLGAGAGVQGNAADGLNRFKRGWSTGTRTAWFCGRIFRRDVYYLLSGAGASEATEFFPAYRGEGFNRDHHDSQ